MRYITLCLLSCAAAGCLPPRGAATPSAGLATAAGATAEARPLPVGWCGPEEERDSLRPSADLYCLVLTPTPRALAARGHVVLGWAPTPFGVAVTREGHQRFAPTLVVEGLPEPGTLGTYGTYVAWAAPPALAPLIRLGEVRNGRTPLAEIPFDKFFVFVSAERDATVPERLGPLVLRGLSASTRMDAHGSLALPPGRPGLAEEAASGARHDHAGAARDAPAERGHAHGGVASGEPAGAATRLDWFTPPMHPVAAMMPQSLDAMRPSVAPFLPGAGRDPAMLREAVPRRVVRLADGDTLRLEAGLVRRTIRGVPLVMYGFNGQYPGPLIEVAQRATIHVELVNGTEWPTALHWHGIRVENAFDGVPGVTQEPVLAGERFLYRVHLPDAGIYWYHPHHREDVLQGLGLYGNVLVRPASETYFSPVNREEVLILDDLLLGDAGLVPFGAEGATHALMGRFGNVLLVNGEPAHALSVRRGETVRFFLTNVSNTRTWNVSFGTLPMKLVGSDLGRFEREEWIESVVLAPAERYIVEVRFPEAGEIALVNRVQAIDHVAGIFFAEVDTLSRVTVAPEPVAHDYRDAFGSLRLHEEVVSEVAPLRAHLGRPADLELVLDMQDRGLPFPLVQLLRLDTAYVHPVEWSGTMPEMDWLPTTREVRWVLREPSTGRENGEIRWRFRVGDLVKLRIANERHSLHPMHHPIHVHGQRFLVLARNDDPVENLVWKDTALIPVGTTADLLIEMSNPGRWMLHCHIAEHLEAGMQMVFEVEREHEK